MSQHHLGHFAEPPCGWATMSRHHLRRVRPACLRRAAPSLLAIYLEIYYDISQPEIRYISRNYFRRDSYV
jgi:hypothetical protein